MTAEIRAWVAGLIAAAVAQQMYAYVDLLAYAWWAACEAGW